MRRLHAVVCSGCRELLTEQVREGVFHCVKCGLIYDEASISCNSMGKHLDVQFSDKEL